MVGTEFQLGSSSYRYSINGQEKSDEINGNFTSALYWEYDSRLGRRWNIDPECYTFESPFTAFSDNPIFMVDILGNKSDIVKGVTSADAVYLQKDIKESLAGNNFKKVRELIKISKDGVTISSISNKDLKTALQGIKLSKDEQALLNTVVSTINSKNIHYAEYKNKDENISDLGLEAMKVDKSAYNKYIIAGMSGKPVEDVKEGEIPAGIFTRVQGGVTTSYGKGSYSLLPKAYENKSEFSDYYTNKGKLTTNPLARPTMHEVFGHGRLLALKIADQHTPVIQFENLILRIMKKEVYRDGTNHGTRQKVVDKDKIPDYTNILQTNIYMP